MLPVGFCVSLYATHDMPITVTSQYRSSRVSYARIIVSNKPTTEAMLDYPFGASKSAGADARENESHQTVPKAGQGLSEHV